MSGGTTKIDDDILRKMFLPEFKNAVEFLLGGFCVIFANVERCEMESSPFPQLGIRSTSITVKSEFYFRLFSRYTRNVVVLTSSSIIKHPEQKPQ